MTQEQKDLLLKDLCARLLYGVITNVENSLIKHKEELEKLKNLTYDGERIKRF